MWAYHDDAASHIGTHKVSLDPYRLESRKIFACMKEALPAKLQKMEKAGIDEVFLDLSAQIHSVLLERYPELNLPAPYDDPTECLPLPPTTVLDWQADALVDLDVDETEDDDPDWDDISILIGSEIVRRVRHAVRENLRYTCSAGVAQNKMLAKLGSGHRKPNQQTVIRNRAVQQFLSEFKFTKIRNLGGKLGDQVVSIFDTDTVKDLLPISIESLKQKLGDDTGTWVHHAIRGIDLSEVNSRTQIKSMLSAKSFRPSINTFEQAVRWLRIFVSDIYFRLVEEGVLENKRRPKTINLHHRHGGQTRSRQGPIPQGKPIDQAMLLDLAKNLLSQVVAEGRVWPCSNLSLSVGGFEDGVSGNKGIGAFLVKGDEARAMRSTTRESDTTLPGRAEKRQRVDDSGRSIQSFFSRIDSVEEHDDEFGAQPNLEDSDAHMDSASRLAGDSDKVPPQNLDLHGPAKSRQQTIDSYLCKRCNKSFDSEETLSNHNDWHFAKDLQNEDRTQSALNASTRGLSVPAKKTTGGSGKKKSGGGSARTDKGQSKLTFR